VTAVRRHLADRARVAFAVGALVGIETILAAAWLMAGDGGWRQGSAWPAALDVLGAVLVAGAWVAARWGGRRAFRERRVVREMERTAGLPEGWAQGALEVSRGLPPGVSRPLAVDAERRASAALSGGAARLGGRLGVAVEGWIRRASWALGAVSLVVVGLVAASSGRAATAWRGLSTPLALLAPPVLPVIRVLPGSVEVLRGSDVRIVVEAPGRTGVELAYQFVGRAARRMRLDLEGGVGGRTFTGVSATLEYEVHTADGAATPRYRIVPVDPLFVTDLVVGVEYPPYTGLPAEEYRGRIPSLRLPVGTRVRFEGRASQPLRTAALLRADSTLAAGFTVDGPRFTGAWRPRAGGSFAWSFFDERGRPAELRPEPFDLVLVPDSAPSIALPVPGQDTILPLNLQQPLIVEARDDYGLERVELVAYRVSALGERHEPVVQGLDLGGVPAALARPLLDLTTWGLLPGDTVRYYARVVDNAPEAHEARTREYVLRMPAASEMRRIAERELAAAARGMEELSREAGRQAEQSRDMEREAAAADGRGREGLQGRPRPGEAAMGFEERQELEKRIESQRNELARVDSLRSRLEALERSMTDAGQADPELRSDLAELRELLEQLGAQELSRKLSDLAASLQGRDAHRAEEALRDLAARQEEFRRRVEASLERFRRAAVDQDFRATEGEADELARQERALADAMREVDDPELRAGQQETLRGRSVELKGRMERLRGRLETLEERDAAEGVRQAGQRVDAANERMAQAREWAGGARNEKAASEADAASQAMEQAADALQDARARQARERAEALLDALRTTADDALALARREAELGRALEGAPPHEVAARRADQASLVQGLRNVAEHLRKAAEPVGGADRALGARLGQAVEALRGTAEAMDRSPRATRSPFVAARDAVGALNRLALRAIAAADEMSRQGGSANGQQVSEQLQQLAQREGNLFSQAGQVMPLQLGAQAMARQLERLAQGQGSVASDLDELRNQPGSEDAALGDLEALAREARALASRLAQGRLTAETLERQERLFHRLLDAGRSLERDEYSDKREAERPGAFERADVLPLGPGALGALRFEMPDAAQLRRLSPAMRQLVLRYFERLNRAGGRTSRPGGGR